MGDVGMRDVGKVRTVNSGKGVFNMSSIPSSLSYLCIIHAATLLLCFSLATSTLNGNETDRRALIEFKAKVTYDPLGVMSSWNQSIHFCKWFGISCGRRHRRVTMLNLQSLNLVGSISPHIGNLSFLRVIHLQNNKFHQRIPPEIGRLHRLEVLYLFNNSIGGKIPSNISSCSNLVQFLVGSNQLVGEIPAMLGFLLKLELFDIERNNFIGSFPSSFGNASSLKFIFVADNNLDGSIPDTLGELKNLTILALGLNGFSGSIPPSIFNLSSILDLDFGANQLQGILPSELGNSLPNLQNFSIYGNQFTGSIPTSISNASNLQKLQLAANMLQGDVPSLENLPKLQILTIFQNYLGSGGRDDLDFLSSLANATSLEQVYLNENNFGGVLPETIGNFSRMLTLLLDNNQISGRIPTGFVNLFNLQAFGARNNKLSGTIPSNIGNLQNLERFDLAKNELSGYIPSSFGNFTKLTIILLEENNLQGSIPSSLGSCQRLVWLSLSQNNLSGSIPPEILGLSSLSILLNLSQNRLDGALSMQVEKLRNLGVLDVSNNLLSGEIPSSLGGCVSLERLYLGGNVFQGPIPSSLSSLRGLRVADLSHNNLSGNIPKFFENFSLETLNLSYNNFEGMVPIEGVFKNASAVSIMGNTKLCGGITAFQLPTCNLNQPSKRSKFVLKIIIPTTFGLVSVILVSYCLFLCRSRRKRKQDALNPCENFLVQVSYQSLLKATNGFSASNLIGIGSFGSVYKGAVDNGKTFIAVKVLNLMQHGAVKTFKAECEALRNIRHRNLVKILTVCSSIDYHGNDFKALVYEFMIHGSLEYWLHPPNGEDTEYEALVRLSLLQIVNIAIDVARALEYLHCHCESPIVHCDLKPSNILLNDEMIGHVSDFGMAKFLLKDMYNCSTNQSRSVGMRGTIGYTPPEYGVGSEVSTHGDMYSYGILLLEMFTGKRPTDEIFENGLNIHNYAKASLSERLLDIIDSIILEEIVEGGTSTNNQIIECLISIFGIGVACSAEIPKERMDISAAAVELCSIRDKLFEIPSRHYMQSTVAI